MVGCTCAGGKTAMLKKFFVVDCETNEIVATVRIGATGRVVFDDPPELRKGSRLIIISFGCDIAMFVFALAGCFIRPLFRVMMLCVSIAAALGLVLLYLGWWLEKSAKKSSVGSEKKKRHLYNGYTPSFGPWIDPYGLGRDYPDDDGKKTYYIVDSEKNAIVDVKRLGKRGQAYLAWRGKRKKKNI